MEQSKQKQIEEMGQMIRVALEYGDFSHLNIHDKDRFLTGRNYIATAENLYNAGCRKIPEGAVVLTREEHKAWIEKIRILEVQLDLERTTSIEQMLKTKGKHTANKIMNDLSGDVLVVDTKEYGSIEVVSLERLVEICKELTEGTNGKEEN